MSIYVMPCRNKGNIDYNIITRVKDDNGGRQVCFYKLIALTAEVLES